MKMNERGWSVLSSCPELDWGRRGGGEAIHRPPHPDFLIYSIDNHPYRVRIAIHLLNITSTSLRIHFAQVGGHGTSQI